MISNHAHSTTLPPLLGVPDGRRETTFRDRRGRTKDAAIGWVNGKSIQKMCFCNSAHRRARRPASSEPSAQRQAGTMLRIVRPHFSFISALQGACVVPPNLTCPPEMRTLYTATCDAAPRPARLARSRGNLTRVVPDFFPQVRFPRVTVLNELLFDQLRCRLLDHMLRIAGQMRQNRSRQRPTRPCAPATLLASRFVHAPRVVLKMHTRISHKNVRRCVLEKPRHRRVRQRPLFELGFIAAQIRAKCSVETQHRARRQSALP
jgi:hypothetical protein